MFATYTSISSLPWKKRSHDLVGVCPCMNYQLPVDFAV